MNALRIVVLAIGFGAILLINRWFVKAYWRFIAKRGDVLRRRRLRRDPWSAKMVATSGMVLLVFLGFCAIGILVPFCAVVSLMAWAFPDTEKSWIALTPIFIMLFAQMYFALRYRSQYLVDR
jgi:hypothetical protein